MSIEDLNERMYRRDFRPERKISSGLDPQAAKPGEAPQYEMRVWEEAHESEVEAEKFNLRRFFSRWWKWVIAGSVLVVLFTVLANVAVIREILFQTGKVTLEITGPKDVASTETVKYVVTYGNRNVLAAEDAEIVVSLPDSFQASDRSSAGGNLSFTIGEIAGGKSGSVSFEGKFYGFRGEVAYPKARMRFTPAGLGSAFDMETQIGVNVGSSPLVAEVTAPQEATSGNEVEYLIVYRNESDRQFGDIVLKADFPDGFRFNSAEPRPVADGKTWRIGNLLPSASGSIRIRGMMVGERNQGKVLRVSLGVEKADGSFISYDQREIVTRIVSSPIFVRQTVNGQSETTINPGDKLNYRIQFANYGDIGISDAILTLEINSPLLDFSRIDLNGKGSFDASRSIIMWTAADVPALGRLEPSQGGEVFFDIPVRADIASGKSLTIRSIAKVDSPNIPLDSKVASSNSIEIRIGTVVAFVADSFYADPNIGNSGPIPPRVGEETRYTIRLRVTNYLNDLTQARVRAVFPTGVRFTGVKYPDTESVTYNERTGDFLWDVGSVWGGGRTDRDFTIQVATTPSANQVGQELTLLQNISFEAEDTFARRSVRIEARPVTTAVNADPTVPRDAYQVTMP